MRSSVCDIQRTSQFVRANAILAIAEHPHRAEPFIEANSRILENRPDLAGELLPGFEARPYQACLQE